MKKLLYSVFSLLCMALVPGIAFGMEKPKETTYFELLPPELQGQVLSYKTLIRELIDRSSSMFIAVDKIKRAAQKGLFPGLLNDYNRTAEVIDLIAHKFKDHLYVNRSAIAIELATPAAIKWLQNAFENTNKERQNIIKYFFNSVTSVNDTEAIAFLASHIPKLINIDEDAEDKLTPLMAAIDLPEIMKLLISLGANVNAQTDDDRQETALMKTIKKDKPESMALLIQAGANLNLKNREEFTALTIAISFEKIWAIKQLIAAGADVNESNWLRSTPLMLAVRNGLLEAVKLLLNAGADIRSKDILERDVFFYAQESKSPNKKEIINLLRGKTPEQAFEEELEETLTEIEKLEKPAGK